MLEMINRLRKVQLQSEIVSSAPENIKFPRIQDIKTSSILPQKLPSNDAILALIENARLRAVADVSAIGINVPETQNFKCQIKCEAGLGESNLDVNDLSDLDDVDDDIPYFDSQQTEEDLDTLAENEIDVELTRNLHTLSSMPGEIILKDYSDFGVKLNEKSPYTVVCDNLGNEKVVRKSTICWLLTRNKHSLSSDRLKRVKQCELVKTSELEYSNKYFYLTL